MPSVETSTTEISALDQALRILQDNKTIWARLPLSQKVAYVDTLRRKTTAVAPRWVQAACKAKQIPAGSSWVGEEWASGPWAVLQSLSQLRHTLGQLEQGLLPRWGAVRTRPDGQVIADVFPLTLYDRILLNNYRAEVWMQPGVTAYNLKDHVAGFYQQAAPQGSVALVLGAGNIASIPPLDVFHKLFNEGQVCLLKLNPVNDYLGPLFEELFEPLIRPGFVQIAYGGADVGQYLVEHKHVDEIHITGSVHTHDAIVFGTGPEAAERKARNEPALRKRITSELGAVSPLIVVPGPWSDADLRFQAEHIVTQKMHNAGFNCVASQILITPEGWPGTRRLIAEVKQVMRSLPPRYPYYPGARDRVSQVLDTHPHAAALNPKTAKDPLRVFVPDLDPEDTDETLFRDECFAGVLGQTVLPSPTAEEYLRRAIRFANDRLWGNLGANILIHPQTLRRMGPVFEDLIAQLCYGTIGVNVWTAFGFLSSQCPWGAFPGNPLNDIQSGQGFVHNTFMFERPQRTVIYGPFAPAPRSWLSGQFHLSPKPAWFVTHRRADRVMRRFTYYQANPGPQHLPGLIRDSLQG